MNSGLTKVIKDLDAIRVFVRDREVYLAVLIKVSRRGAPGRD
jgi:hypothetical protein